MIEEEDVPLVIILVLLAGLVYCSCKSADGRHLKGSGMTDWFNYDQVVKTRQLIRDAKHARYELKLAKEKRMSII